MTEEASRRQKTGDPLPAMKPNTSRTMNASQRGASSSQPRSHHVEKVLRNHPGLPRRLQAAKPTGAYKWIEQLPRKLCVSRKSPAHVLLRCRQLLDQSRNLALEFDVNELDAIKHRLRVRMETMWEELKIPHVDRDSFLVLHGGCIPSLVHQVQLLTVHFQCTLRVLHCIQYREELLEQARELHAAMDNEVWMQSMIQVSVATVEAIEMWRDTLWFPHAFRTKHGPNYLLKMVADCSTMEFERACCPILAPLDPPNRANVQVGQFNAMAPSPRQWRAARTLKGEADVHMQVVAMHAQWANAEQFVPLLKWDATPMQAASVPPPVQIRSFANTPCFIQQPWTSCVRLTTVVAIATMQRRWRARKTIQGQHIPSERRENPNALPPLLLRATSMSSSWAPVAIRLDHVPHCVVDRIMTYESVLVPRHLPCARGSEVVEAQPRSATVTAWMSLQPPRPSIKKAAVRRIAKAWKGHRQRHMDAKKQEKLRAYCDLWLNSRSHKPTPQAGASISMTPLDSTKRHEMSHLPEVTNATATVLASITCQLPSTTTNENFAATLIQRWWRTWCHCRAVKQPIEPRRRPLPGPPLRPFKTVMSKPGPPVSPLKAVTSKFQVWWTRFRHANEHDRWVALDKLTKRRIQHAVVSIQHRWRSYLQQKIQRAKLTALRAATWLSHRQSTSLQTRIQIDSTVQTPWADAEPVPHGRGCEPSVVCYRLEHWVVEHVQSTNPSPIACFLHVQVIEDPTSLSICTFQTPHVPYHHDVVEWDHVSFFVPGVAMKHTKVVVTIVGVTLWKKYKFLGQMTGPLHVAAPRACHEARHPVFLKPGKPSVVYCNDSASTSLLTAEVRWSCAPVPCRMSGRTAGFLSSMGDSTRHGGDAFFMGVFDDNHLVVYLDANRSKPVLRLDLKCVHSFVMDNTDDSPCVRMQFVDSRNHMHLFVFECRGNDGLQEARKWAAVFTNATAR